MKNKKFTIGLTLLMAGTLVLTNCTKGKMNQAPSPDYEFKSTQDMNRVQMILADIDEIGATASNQYTTLLGWQSYTPLMTVLNSNTITSSAGVIAAPGTYYTVTFNNTIGKDGHVRNGMLTFDFGTTTTLTGVFYGRQPAFSASVTAVGYTVDDYSVAINHMLITNTTPVGFPTTTPYTPANYNLTWSQASDVTITHALGTGTNATIETSSFVGTINKTLLNTKIGTFVPMPTGIPVTYTVYPSNGSSLTVQRAWYSYSGTGTGVLPDVGPYGVTITNLSRNFISSPENFYVDAQTGMIVTPERHPFLSGKMSFKPGNKPTRDVDFGSDDVCDYNAKVTISGITYDVDCK
jgi:hypothetical protein